MRLVNAPFSCIVGKRRSDGAVRGVRPVPEDVIRLGQFELPQKDLEKAQSAGGTSAETLYDLGVAAYMRHDYADAPKHFSDALASDGGMGRASDNRGVPAFALSPYENALADCNTAQRLGSPSENVALFNRALTYQTVRALDRAMADSDRIIAPNDPELYFNRTLAREAMAASTHAISRLMDAATSAIFKSGGRTLQV